MSWQNEAEHLLEEQYGFEVFRGADDFWYYRHDDYVSGPFEYQSDVQDVIAQIVGVERITDLLDPERR